MDSRERATTPTTWTEPGRAPILRSIELVAACGISSARQRLPRGRHLVLVASLQTTA
ncbi:hypothetical protein [Ornithinimicrobium kibberense]|uniref:hypothetical protein n=1 Tax=Ornithinimicrobium kibberense TaxID=282060 RepID=UPI00361F5350